MGQSEKAYLQSRVEEARQRAAVATDPIVRDTHERFAAAYGERLAQLVRRAALPRGSAVTVDTLLN